MSRATWWHSRTSPASTTSPARVRDFCLIRWWCTAPVSSSDGIGRGAGPRPLGRPGGMMRGAQALAATGRVVAAVDHVRGETGQVALVVDVHDLGQVVVVDHGVGLHDL